MKKPADQRTGHLFRAGEDLPLFGGKSPKQEEAARVVRTKAEIKRLEEELKKLTQAYETNSKATRDWLAAKEPGTKKIQMPLATAKERKLEDARLLRVRSQFRDVKKNYDDAHKAFEGHRHRTEKRIVELRHSLSTGAHAIGPDPRVFGIDFDPKYGG